MIIVMKPNANSSEIDHIKEVVKMSGCKADIVKGEENVIIGVIGDVKKINQVVIERAPGVDKIVPIVRPYKLASREFHPEDTIIKVNGARIGGNNINVIAGPCAVETRDQLMKTAHEVKKAGAHLLRGGAFKPRSSPYSFQGLGEEGLHILAQAKRETGLPIVTEVMDQHMIPLVNQFADVIQVGARNMQNYALLHALGELNKPVLLKRGMMSTIEELLMAAEYILSHGNKNIILCERGIRTFETSTRNTLDISAVPVIKQLSHLPVIVDPSHGTGKWELVEPLSKAAIAAGADGLMIEVHPDPIHALSDGVQSLKPQKFQQLMEGIKPIAIALGKTI